MSHSGTLQRPRHRREQARDQPRAVRPTGKGELTLKGDFETRPCGTVTGGQADAPFGRIINSVTIAKRAWAGQRRRMDALMERLLPGRRRGTHRALEDAQFLTLLMPQFVPCHDHKVDALLKGRGLARQARASAPQQPAPLGVPALGIGMREVSLRRSPAPSPSRRRPRCGPLARTGVADRNQPTPRSPGVAPQRR